MASGPRLRLAPEAPLPCSPCGLKLRNLSLRASFHRGHMVDQGSGSSPIRVTVAFAWAQGGIRTSRTPPWAFPCAGMASSARHPRFGRGPFSVTCSSARQGTFAAYPCPLRGHLQADRYSTVPLSAPAPRARAAHARPIRGLTSKSDRGSNWPLSLTCVCCADPDLLGTFGAVALPFLGHPSKSIKPLVAKVLFAQNANKSLIFNHLMGYNCLQEEGKSPA